MAIMTLLEIECMTASSDSLRLIVNGSKAHIRIIYEHDDPCIALNVETATRLRDTLSKWIGDQS